MAQDPARSQLNTNNHICQRLHFSEEYLGKCEIVTNLECPLKNCNEIFSNRSALNLHLEKVHRVYLKNDNLTEFTATRSKSKKTKQEENCKCEYYCPSLQCKYSLQGKRSLPTFHSLKVHFIRIHGDKKHKCPHCEKSFSIKSEMERHEKNCGHIIRCNLCSIDYSTQQSYRKHCLKKGHAVDASCSILAAAKSSINSRKSMLLSSLAENNNTESCNKAVATTTRTEMRSIPLILLPVCATTTPPGAIVSLSHTNINEANHHQQLVIDASAHHQRCSLGCQTSVQTQEVGSQTKTNEMSQQQTQTTTTTVNYPASAAQQFAPPTSCEQMGHSGVESHEYFHHDAATSTSPPLIREEDIEMFLMNDISTQTISTQQPELDQFRSISIQTLDSTNMTTDDDDYANLNQGYFGIDSCTDEHQQQTSRTTNSSIKSGLSSQSHLNLNRSCVTPINMCNAPSQTEDFYFTSILGTCSIQTQTNFSRNGAQTQTEFNFS